MKMLIIVFLFLPSLSWAAPFVCFSGAKVASGSVDGVENVPIYLAGHPDAAYGYSDEEIRYELAAFNPSCEAIQNTAFGLTATSLLFSGVGWGLTCTGVGVPATILLHGASIGTAALGLVVGQLPCDNRTKDAEIKKMAEVVVCQELAKQGIGCSLNR